MWGAAATPAAPRPSESAGQCRLLEFQQNQGAAEGGVELGPKNQINPSGLVAATGALLMAKSFVTYAVSRALGALLRSFCC
jgi:hypothetical protein